MLKVPGSIPTRSEHPDLGRFPDFLILGPQRTGTTWLYFNLHLHPEILLHRMKETYFFSTLGKPDNPHFLFPYLEDYLDSYREPLPERLKKHYVSLRKSLSFYRPKIRGEATASYALLPEEIVAEIVRLKPQIKGIIMLRDPVERAWSHAKKTLVRGKSEPVGFEKFRAYFETSGQKRRAGYSAMIALWKKHLAPGNLHIGLYDRIATSPKALLEEMEGFLGVTTKALYFNRHLTIKLNPTSEDSMPGEVRAFLGEFLADEIASYRGLLKEVGNGRTF
ncbi:MAG: sulfotransferase [Terrimicrobiaceae bacterium]